MPTTTLPAEGSPKPDRELYDFLSPPQADDELGRLGSYRVLKVLGAGGMGVVFLAEDLLLKRRVALKAMLPRLATSATARQRFAREARSVAALKHDHIVAIYQVGEDRGVPFLAMELLDGESLEDRLQRERTLPVADVMRIGRETAEGLSAAHALALIHRDIKPANLWLEVRDQPAWRVKILDFGLARGGDDANLTQQDAVIGTPAYMSPEQGAGETVDHRSDLFSLGCVLYRACIGRAPFSGVNTIAILRAVEKEHPPAPHDVNAVIPLSLSDLIMRLLAKAPKDRPASAHVVAQELRKIEIDFANRGLRSAVAATTMIVSKGRTFHHSRRIWWIGGILSLLVFGAVLQMVTNRGERIPEPPAVSEGNSLDALDPAQIPSAERFPWQPKELVAVIGEHRQRHWGEVASLAIRPDGGQAASSGSDQRIRFWDTTTRKEIVALQIDANASALAWSPDGKRFVSGGDRVQIWDLSGAKPIRRTVIPDSAFEYQSTLAISSDGTALVYDIRGNNDARDGVWLWDVSQNEPQLREKYPGAESAVLSADGKVLAVVFREEPQVRIFDLT